MNVEEKSAELLAEARKLYAEQGKSKPLDHWLMRLAEFAKYREGVLKREIEQLKTYSRAASRERFAKEAKEFTFYAEHSLTPLDRIHARKLRREAAAVRLRNSGMTFRQVGEAFGVSASRAQMMVRSGERAERYAKRQSESAYRNTDEREAAASLRRYRSAGDVLTMLVGGA